MKNIIERTSSYKEHQHSGAIEKKSKMHSPLFAEPFNQLHVTNYVIKRHYDMTTNYIIIHHCYNEY